MPDLTFLSSNSKTSSQSLSPYLCLGSDGASWKILLSQRKSLHNSKIIRKTVDPRSNGRLLDALGLEVLILARTMLKHITGVGFGKKTAWLVEHAQY